MRYSETHFCITCGSRILDDPIAKECAVCRVRGDVVGQSDSHSASSAADETGVRNPEKSRRIKEVLVLVWFALGAMWYVSSIVDLSSVDDGWPLFVDALRPDGLLSFFLKTLGVVVAGPMVLSRYAAPIGSFTVVVFKQVVVAVVVITVVLAVLNPAIREEIALIGSDFMDRFTEEDSNLEAGPDDSGIVISSEAGSAAGNPLIGPDITGSLSEESSDGFESKDLQSIVELRQLVLGFINADRAKHGIDPVVLGNNSAAQDHANDMLVFGYLGHWWVDGKKPYMAYSQAGGTSYVAENAAVSGHKVAGYVDNDCSSFFSLCEAMDPETNLADLQFAMVYDDAVSNWGHRDTMLDPNHSEVSIGIAFDEEFISLVQHFSGGSAKAVQGPAFVGTQLSMKVEILDDSIEVFEAIPIWWEPLPTPKDPAAIGALRSYCVGGDFTVECGDPVFTVIPPPPFGQFYEGLTDDQVVADKWNVESGVFDFSATLPRTKMKTGMYTVSVLADEGGEYSDQVLVQLSARFVE